MTKKILSTKILPVLAAFGTAFVFNACGDDSSSSSPNKPECVNESCDDSKDAAEKSVYVFGSDYASGELNVVDGEALKAIDIKLDQDSKLVSVNNNLFILSRSGEGSIMLFDTESNKALWQVKAGSGNPYDVVMADKLTAWVAMNGKAELVQVSLDDGSTVKTVSTKDFISIKGAETPNVADLEVSGDTLFAVFQRYLSDPETWAMTYSKGLLAMYNLSDGTLLDTIQLATLNPQAVKVVKGEVFVGSMGDYAEEMGAIEKVDLEKKTSEVFVSSKDLGGSVNAMVVDYKNAKAFVAVYKMYGSVPVAEVDLASGKVTEIEGVVDAEGSLAYDAATGKLYVGDRGVMDFETYMSSDYMVKVYDGKEVKEIDNGKALPPYSIALF